MPNKYKNEDTKYLQMGHTILLVRFVHTNTRMKMIYDYNQGQSGMRFFRIFPDFKFFSLKNLLLKFVKEAQKILFPRCRGVNSGLFVDFQDFLSLVTRTLLQIFPVNHPLAVSNP